MSEIKTVQIFHAVDYHGSVLGLSTPREAAKAFKNGGYYMAGIINVQPDSNIEDVMKIAWIQTQNDNHPIRKLKRPYGSFVTQPAEWNGLFAQRSSAVGDIFVHGKHHFLVTGTGFEPITLPKNAKHTENPYHEASIRERDHEWADMGEPN